MPDDVLSAWFDRLAAVPNAAGSKAEGASPPPSKSAERLLLSVSRCAMACEFEVLLNQFQFANATETAMEALDLVEQLENKLSVYRMGSDLSMLNRFGAERAVAVSLDTLALLQLARDVGQLTGGAFDITAGTLSDVWGFSRRLGKMPTESQIVEALANVGSNHLELDEIGSRARLTKQGVKVNPGGIGKGYALDRAARQLTAAGIDDFMLHGGLSSVVARGNRQHPETGGGWLVSLRHPWRIEEMLGTIRLRDRALATSGSGKQFFHFGGKRYSHIIDPRTGWPAESMLSATVICPSGAVADALATGMFVMGVEATRDFCERHPSIAAIIVVADGRTSRSRIEVFNATDDLWRPLF